RKKYA
ncbi:Aspartate-semialdehyde dehydrogenase, partial [Haemophilus influenzae]